MMTSTTTPQRPWLIAIALPLGVCVSNGFAHFAYGLILPVMRDELAWNYAQAGWINTANALGYLAGGAYSAGATGTISGIAAFL